MVSTSRSFFSLLLCVLPLVRADATIYVPAFQDSPLSVSKLGVGSGGETTWQVVVGTPMGNDHPDEVFPATATLIEDSSNARLIYNNPGGASGSMSCVIGANGVSTCDGVVKQFGETYTASGLQEMATAIVFHDDSSSGNPNSVAGGSSPPAPGPGSNTNTAGGADNTGKKDDSGTGKLGPTLFSSIFVGLLAYHLGFVG